MIPTVESALAAIEGIDGEIIIVNDSKTEEVILPWEKENVVVIRNPRYGAASARNYGAKHAKGKYLFFLDDDMLLLPSSISTLLQLYQGYPRSCFNVNWILYPPLTEQIADSYFGKYLIHYGFTTLYGWYGLSEQWPQDQVISVSSIASCALFIEKSVFYDIGGYEESIPYAGFEDYILSKKLSDANVNMYVYSTILAYHNESHQLNLESWLLRKSRGGATRAAAVIAGYEELSIRHSFIKRLSYLLAYYLGIKKYLLRIAKWSEKVEVPLPLYFRIVNMLLGLYHFEGYYQYLQKHANQKQKKDISHHI